MAPIAALASASELREKKFALHFPISLLLLFTIVVLGTNKRD